MKRFQILTLVAATFLFAFLTELLTLGTVRLKPVCEFCDHEVELRNIWSHMRWHLKRGEWR